MNPADLRIVFAGTPDFAAAHLDALLQAGHNVVSVYSQPDRPAGRGKKVQPTAVKALALTHGLSVQQPLTLKDPAELARLADCQAHLMIVVAYGLLLPATVLALPTLGCLNVHASLLPRWRGAAPIERAIMAGDRESGVSVMLMDEGLDTGPVLLRRSTPIYDQDNSTTLGQRLCRLGCEALVTTLGLLPGCLQQAEPQDERLASYAPKIRKTEAEANWNLDAATLNQLARALYPRSPAFTWHEGKRLRLLNTRVLGDAATHAPGTVVACSAAGMDVACGDGVLRVSEVQVEGRNAMSVASLLNGHPGCLRPGMLLGGQAG